MFYTASHLQLLTNNSLKLENDIYYHKGEAMRIINESLNDPVARISDQIIGALSSLTIYEEMYGDSDVAKLHRIGLEELLEQRKATPNLEMFWLVKHLIIHACPDLDLKNKSSDPEINTEQLVADMIPPLHTQRSQLPATAIIEVFTWLKKTAIPARNSRHKSEKSYLAAGRIEEQRVEFTQHPTSILNNSPLPCFIASLIYLHTIIATAEEAARLPETELHLIIRLRDYIHLMDLSIKEDASSNAVLLWTLMFGGLHALGEEKKVIRTGIQVVLDKV